MEAIEYTVIKPNHELADFVESFWMLANHSNETRDIVILPDGRIDLSFSPVEPYSAVLLGLETEASQAAIAPKSTMFAISFKLLAVEYILDGKFSSLLNSAYELPQGYLGISFSELPDFEIFCNVISEKLTTLLKNDVDERKRKLFNSIYNSKGSISVSELSASIGWSSRQINWYFDERFGLSLKAYCNVLRFRASFGHIKEGKLFPEQNFADQAHFIKEVKKYTGVTPKELKKNNNDRFIQFSLLPRE